MREAPALEIVAALAARGARVVAYDPIAMSEAKRVFGDAPHLSYATSPMATLEGADALLVITEWKEFRSPDFDAIRTQLKEPLVFDGRNLYDPQQVRAAGLEYFAIGPPLKAHAPMPTFAEFRKRVAHTKVLVVGDVMLDRYWFGDVERISPEAPVPVVKVTRREERPGGAANVARNASALGAPVTLLSVTGDDEAGALLEKLLASDNIRTSFHRDPSLPTTIKLRVIGRQQQLLRVDFETAPSHEVLGDQVGRLQSAASGLRCRDPVGLWQRRPRAYRDDDRARTQHRANAVLVDPKGEDWARYRGATIITPNRAEFRQVVGRWRDDDEMTTKAQALRADLDLEALLVTRSEEGMSLYTADGTHHVAAQAREVYDVSGAGRHGDRDRRVLMGAGADLPTAVRIANQAASVVVGKLGTAVVTPDELE
jgi:bifunctional ADP-heptose synthase (sugar kinase/adenylyltransferase)